MPRALLFAALGILSLEVSASLTERIFLSGTGSDDTVEWEFKVNGGRHAGEWSRIPVPSNWEMQGFGTYHYEKDWGENPAPDSEGRYRHQFSVPEEWEGMRIELVFGGSMTDTTAWINGEQVGPVHRGGFYQFRYEVSELIGVGGENSLEVLVRKYSSDESVNRAERSADYWLFGGIFRPVWLEARPVESIQHFALDARHDGSIDLQVELNGIASADRLTAQVVSPVGEPMGSVLISSLAPGQKTASVSGLIDGIKEWSAEWPHLYRIEIALKSGEMELHRESGRFGFRTIEVRPHDGIYLNGRPIRIRGVNRHSFWPTTGRTTNAALSRRDVELIKGMNMNAVRMSHYPPDPHFLDICDELGLYVIDELAGWQKAYDTEPGAKLVREMVRRDVNHPSIILWANGNEGGYNDELVDDYGQYDPQNRTVIKPWLNFNGVDTTHYLPYDCCVTSGLGGDDLYMPTEFLHALYDGGGGAGLQDWWDRMRNHPLAVGGFIWAFADEGVVREDRGGAIDVHGNRAPDGLVGPYREKEGSYYAVKEIWSPVQIPLARIDRLSPEFDGRIAVENDFDFTRMSQLHFVAELVRLPTPVDRRSEHVLSGRKVPVTVEDIAPRGAGFLELELPADWRDADALRLTAVDPSGVEIYTWTWMVTSAAESAQRIVVDSGDAGKTWRVGELALIALQSGTFTANFSAHSGQLLSLRRGDSEMDLSNGPRVIGESSTIDQIHVVRTGDSEQIVCTYAKGPLTSVKWTLHSSGWLQLDYSYQLSRFSKRDSLGVTFDLSDSDISAMRWLGRGPYRVWKNRLAGVEFGLWEKQSNNGGTGWTWNYPEFPGFHANLYWATLETGSLPLTVVSATDDLFLRVFTPEDGPDPRHTSVPFPEGDISFLQGIPPVGTKFHPAAAHGPQGSSNAVGKGNQWSATLYFYYGEMGR